MSDEPGRPRTPYGSDARAAEHRARNVVPARLAPPSADQAARARLRHCWVHTDGQRLPGLLLGWRAAGDGWEGRVIVPALVEDTWVPREAWLPADRLEQTQQLAGTSA